MLNIIFGGTSIFLKINCNKCSLLTPRNKKYTYIYIVQCLLSRFSVSKGLKSAPNPLVLSAYVDRMFFR